MKQKVTGKLSFVGSLSRDPFFGYILITPILIWMIAILVYPLFRAAHMSFLDIGFIGEQGSFIGFSGYTELFRNPEFREGLLRSIIWTGANVVVQVAIAFLAALILDMEFRGRSFVRIWVLLPWVVPVIVLATMWRWMLEPSLGIVNYVLLATGTIQSRIPFIGSTQFAMGTAIVVNSWRWFPFYAIIILAALQTIPQDTFQAAKVDGANGLQQFRYITLPSIAPMLSTVVLLSSLWAANVFDMLLLLTRGGPRDATTTLPIMIYRAGFQRYQLSQAAVIAIVMFVLLLVYAVIYMKTLGAQEEYQQ